MLEIYEYCQSFRLPVMIHQGTTFVRTAPLKYALPILLDDIAISFPKLHMIVAHMGYPWINETLVVIRKHRHERDRHRAQLVANQLDDRRLGGPHEIDRHQQQPIQVFAGLGRHVISPRTKVRPQLAMIRCGTIRRWQSF